jgi:hypothetical protein
MMSEAGVSDAPAGVRTRCAMCDVRVVSGEQVLTRPNNS